MRKENGLLTACGSDCTKCANYQELKQPKCTGCTQMQGKPFWAKDVCPIYACTREKRVDHCGACGQFPCEQFISHYDPNNPEGERNAVTRAGILAYRSRHGSEKAARLIDKIEKPQKD